MEKKWNCYKILQDLELLKAKGEKPNPYSLKEKYGYELLSEFFPVLDRIGKDIKEMREFVEEIFSRVTDPHDLNFRHGPCKCPMCQEE